MKSFLVDVSFLTGATDTNPVNEVVQLLSDFETKIQEAWRPNNFTSVLSLFGVSQTSDLVFAVQKEQKDPADLEAGLGAASEGIAHED